MMQKLAGGYTPVVLSADLLMAGKFAVVGAPV